MKGGLTSSQGFTLIEMMMAIAVMAIVLAAGMPSFGNAFLGNRLAAHANSLVASVALARSEAIKRNTTVTLCASANGSSCSSSGGWEQGWIVKEAAPGSAVLQRQQAIASGMKITQSGGTAELSFHSSGLSAGFATLTICRASPEPGYQERVVSISLTSRPSVSKTTTGSCA
jgi:type IV fimbrial biogenesis protein FimT